MERLFSWDATARNLDDLQRVIAKKGGQSVSVVCDLSDLASVHRAAAEIVALDLPIAGLVNNAGIMQMRATKNALGWDMSFATNHCGPFVLTEALIPQPRGWCKRCLRCVCCGRSRA